MPSISKKLVWLTVLLLGVALYTVGYFFLGQKPLWTPDMTDLLKARTAGDDNAALAQYQEIQSNPNATDMEKALATISIAGTQFSMSGDTSAQLQDIQNLKKVIVDTTISKGVRAMAMAILGNMYNASGGDPAVFSEIYKGAPFDSYLVPGNPRLSAINIEKASYAMSTTSTAAINVAQIATEILFYNPRMAATTTAAYVALAEDYLKKANDSVLIEARGGAWYVDSAQYMNYRKGRAITIGRLALKKVGDHEDTYRNEFEDFFTFAHSKTSNGARDAVLGTRFQYAKILGAAKDAAEQKKQLDVLADELNALSNPNIRFVAIMRNERTYEPTGPAWLAVKKMFEVSPDFKVALEKILDAKN